MILQSLTLPDLGTLKGPLSQGKDYANIGELISALLPYIFVIAGLILFVIIIFAGFTIFTSATNPDKVKQAQQQLTFGIIGFLIIFFSYWIAQILGNIFGLSFLGG